MTQTATRTRPPAIPGRFRRLATVLAALAIVAGACSGDDDTDAAESGDTSTSSTSITAAPDEENDPSDTTEPPETSGPVDLPASYAGHRSDQYDDLDHWICHGDLDDDPCDAADLDVTLVAADGTRTVIDHRPAPAPEVACFYVYPTTSEDETSISDLDPGSEISATVNQAAFLSETCEVFAPVYRSFTVALLTGAATDTPPDGASDLVYGDVHDAFRTFIVDHADDRPFVLLGHSQGAGHLRRLLDEEIDGEPLLRDRLVAAYLLGSTVAVTDAVGGDGTGGDFDNIPLCRSRGQTGCVVSYASYRASDPPGEGSVFGASSAPGTRAACVHPGSLADGGPAPLTPVFSVDQTTGYTDGAAAAPIETPWVGLPGLVIATCRTNERRTWLEVAIDADPDDPRIDDIPGDLPLPGWGLHLIDVGLARLAIADLVAAQADAAIGR